MSTVTVLAVCPLAVSTRSEEHTSELQSLRHLVCRLLLEKKLDESGLALSFRPGHGSGSDFKAEAGAFQLHCYFFRRAATGSHYSLPCRSVGGGGRGPIPYDRIYAVLKGSEKSRTGAERKPGATGSGVSK